MLNRRFDAVFIAALSVIALLSGCSGENSQPDTSDAVSSAVSDKMDSQTQESPSSEVSDNPDTNQVSMEDLSSASSQSISSAIEESKTQDDSDTPSVIEEPSEISDVSEDSSSSDDKSKLYSAYLEVVSSLINDYGMANIVNKNVGESDYSISGLSYAKLFDFDNDGNEELICVYGPVTDENGIKKPDYVKVFGYDGSNVITLFESGAFFFADTDLNWGYRLAYYEENGQIIFLTKKNPMTFSIYEWSKLDGNRFEVVKSFSDYNEADPGNMKYTVDNTEVGREDFISQLDEWKKKQTYVILDSDSKEMLEKTISETSGTLNTLGYS